MCIDMRIGNLQQRDGRVVVRVEEHDLRRVAQRHELLTLGTRSSHVAGSRERRASGVVGDRGRVVKRRIRHRLGEDVVPPAELRQGEQRDRLEELDGRKLLDLLDPHVVGDLPRRELGVLVVRRTLDDDTHDLRGALGVGGDVPLEKLGFGSDAEYTVQDLFDPARPEYRWRGARKRTGIPAGARY